MNPSAGDFEPTLDISKRRMVVEGNRIAARIASWDDIHVGIPGSVRMPKQVNVNAAHIGVTELDDGSEIETAVLPLHTTHAAHGMDVEHAAAWYEDSGKRVARIRYSTDDIGIRADGVLFSDVSEIDIQHLKAGAPSGDWRFASLLRSADDFENTPADFAGAAIVNIAGFSDNYGNFAGKPVRLAASGDGSLIFTEDVNSLTAAGRPLADRARPWDSSAAQQRVKAWATTNGKIDFGKYGQAFMYHDASKPKELTSYKLQYADVINGKLVDIPRAVFAIAAVLQGSRGGVNLPAGSVAGVKAHVANIYGEMRTKFNDKTIQVPWKNDAMKASAIDDDGFDPADEEVIVDCDGSCETCTCGKKDDLTAAAAPTNMASSDSAATIHDLEDRVAALESLCLQMVANY